MTQPLSEGETEVGQWKDGETHWCKQVPGEEEEEEEKKKKEGEGKEEGKEEEEEEEEEEEVPRVLLVRYYSADQTKKD